MRNTIMARKKAYHDCKPMFQAIFNLPFDDYWDTIFGFDIIKFNDDVECPDNISLKDFIGNKYGEEASLLIAHLIE